MKVPMRATRTAAIASVAVMALFGTAACGKSGSPKSEDNPPASGGTGGPPQALTYQVKQGVDLSQSATWKRAHDRGKLIIGAKEDQPFLGDLDPATNQRTGFDIEIAKMVAADLGFTPDQVKFETIQSANRETALQSGQVDLYVGTYSITPERKKLVGFAGPYYISGQGLLVARDNTSITGKDTIAGKTVCSVKGSTPLKNLQDNFPQTKTKFFDNYTDCVNDLLNKQVDAVSTDDAILKGYAAKQPDKLKVVGDPFTVEKYGVGLNKNDATLRAAVNDALRNHEQNGDWNKAYDATLGRSGSPAPNIPAIEAY